ncbi:unnamed protein product, partial [marine sediment metagenome]
GYFTIMGDSLEKCIRILEQENVDVIGAKVPDAQAGFEAGMGALLAASITD